MPMQCKNNRSAHHFVIDTPVPNQSHMMGKCKYCGAFKAYRKEPLGGWQAEGDKSAKSKQVKKTGMARK